MRQKIADLVKKSFPTTVAFEVFVPEEAEFGHYSTNAALKLAKEVKKPPLEIAQGIKKELEKKSPADFFEKIEVAPPGFINFWLSKKTLQDELKNILKSGAKYGSGKKKDKTLVEFLSANPTGPIHIGNGRGAFLGDVLTKALRLAGFSVKSEYYINDAKASEQIKNLGRTALGESNAYPYVRELYLKRNPALAKKLKKLSTAEAGYELAQYIHKTNRDVIENKLGVKYDGFFHEESLFKSGSVEKAVGLLKKKKLTYEKDGALWFRAKDYGDNEDRVLIRKTGEPTYFTTDLAYHLNKFQGRKFNKAVDIWGADHHGYAPRLKAALLALGAAKDKFEIIITQFVRLVSGGQEVKMSKRLGQIEELEVLVKEVGLDAARFFFLMHSPDSHMDFDLKLAKERSLKNPVYYVQYAFVRMNSILVKANSKLKNPNLKFLNTKEDLNLIKMLIRFPEIVEDTAQDYQVHRFTKYALELSKTLHNFYEKERVIGEEKELVEARLSLVKATQIVLGLTLDLLGISKPQKM